MKIISQNSIFILNLFCLAILLQGCGSYRTIDFSEEKSPEAPDYSNKNAWAVLPSNYRDDFKRYASNRIDTLSADVFYVYPTLNTEKKDNRWNVPIEDTKQQEKVLGSAVLMQASAFATAGKLYVPFYRQAHIRSYQMLESGGKQALDLAYQDVRKAFGYYLKHFNQGRPIILVGHSQGTTHSLRLLNDFFDGKELQKQLIAAYIPGIGVKSNRFSKIQTMTRPNQTGGFVSWNTFKRKHYPKKDKDWYKGSVTTNPITWDSQRKTSLEEHKGFLYSNGKMYSKALRIEVTDGLIWSSNPKFPLRFFMSFLKNYHVGDINLFWQDIRENALLRVASYFKNN